MQYKCLTNQAFLGIGGSQSVESSKFADRRLTFEALRILTLDPSLASTVVSIFLPSVFVRTRVTGSFLASLFVTARALKKITDNRITDGGLDIWIGG